jgi:hypothetical protein
MRLLPIIALLAVTCAGTAIARDVDNPPPLGDTPDGSEPNVPSNANEAHDRFNSETRAKSDDMLATAVSESLHDDPKVNAMKVKVGVDKGVVTLTGEVLGNDERQAAETAAQRVAGVREVRNQLTVAETAAPAPGTSPIPEKTAP